MPALTHAFETIAMAKVSTSAAEAKDLLFLRQDDGIVMNRQRVLAAAKTRVLALAENYTPPQPETVRLPGSSGRAALDMALDGFAKRGLVTEHDLVVARALAGVLTGADTDILDEVTEETLLALERDALTKLSLTRRTRARVSHMLFKGKPLRN